MFCTVTNFFETSFSLECGILNAAARDLFNPILEAF